MGLLFNDFNYFNVLLNSLIFLKIIPECQKVKKLLSIGFRLRNNSPVTSKSTWRVPESRSSQRRDAISIKAQFLDNFIQFLF